MQKVKVEGHSVQAYSGNGRTVERRAGEAIVLSFGRSISSSVGYSDIVSTVLQNTLIAVELTQCDIL